MRSLAPLLATATWLAAGCHDNPVEPVVYAVDGGTGCGCRLAAFDGERALLASFDPDHLDLTLETEELDGAARPMVRGEEGALIVDRASGTLTNRVNGQAVVTGEPLVDATADNIGSDLDRRFFAAAAIAPRVIIHQADGELLGGIDLSDDFADPAPQIASLTISEDLLLVAVTTTTDPGTTVLAIALDSLEEVARLSLPGGAPSGLFTGVGDLVFLPTGDREDEPGCVNQIDPADPVSSTCLVPNTMLDGVARTVWPSRSPLVTVDHGDGTGRIATIDADGAILDDRPSRAAERPVDVVGCWHFLLYTDGQTGHLHVRDIFHDTWLTDDAGLSLGAPAADVGALTCNASY